jgi:hypothetical protein
MLFREGKYEGGCVSCDNNRGMHWAKCQNSSLRNLQLASLAYPPYKSLGKMWTVTETASMEESNGTNLKPISPILFFNKCMKIRDVLVLRQDKWRERLRSTSTPLGLKVLTLCQYYLQLQSGACFHSRYFSAEYDLNSSKTLEKARNR